MPSINVSRLTDRARLAIKYATEVAKLMNDNYVGTEHLALGAMKAGGVGGCAIRNRMSVRDACGGFCDESAVIAVAKWMCDGGNSIELLPDSAAVSGI